MRAPKTVPVVVVAIAAVLGACDREPGPTTAAATPDAPPPATPLAAPKPRDDVDDADRRFADAMTGHRELRSTDDLVAVKTRGVLRVLTRNNSTSYFLYKGNEAGFHFEIAKLLADELGVRLEMVVPPANRDVIPWLLEGRGDIVIAGTPLDAPRVDRVKATRPYLRTSLVVVTKKGAPNKPGSVAQLAGITTLVRPSSSAMTRLRQMANDTGVPISLRAALETLEPEDLIDLVASGEADAAVLERRIVDVELMYRDDVEIAFEIPGETVEAAFLVRKENGELFAAADEFLRRQYRSTVWNILYKRYHEKTTRGAEAHADELRGDKAGALSPWDDTFQAAAKSANLDWRLLVSQCVQESRLDTKARSNFGAMGLMQMMPATAKEVGVVDPYDPIQSIEGGARYMAKVLARYGDDVELKDRVRFALASYNAGPMHVKDARALAQKLGLDPNKWFGNVEKAMLLLSKPRYYREAPYGYCRGEEPVKYVSEIQSRYDHYVALTDPPPAQGDRP